MLAIIIPTKSNLEVLFQCLTSIKRFVTCPYKLYIGDTGSSTEEKTKILNWLKIQFNDKFQFIEYDFYNYAIINNLIVKDFVKEPLLCFLNNDIEFTDDTLDVMYYTFLNIKRLGNQVGTIGCRLIYPNINTIQHDGQIIGRLNDGEYAISHINLRKYAGSIEYKELRPVMGNTFACCITQNNVFCQLGMLNQQYKYCFEDLEYNLKCIDNGYQNFILPSKYSAIHHESYSRKQTPKYFDIADYHLIRSYLDKSLKENK